VLRDSRESERNSLCESKRRSDNGSKGKSLYSKTSLEDMLNKIPTYKINVKTLPIFIK